MDMSKVDLSSSNTNLPSTKLGFHLTISVRQTFPWLWPNLGILYPELDRIHLEEYVRYILEDATLLACSRGDITTYRGFHATTKNHAQVNNLVIAASEILTKVVDRYNIGNTPAFFYLYSMAEDIYTIHVMPDGG